jgi:membrane protein required for colicin V production
MNWLDIVLIVVIGLATFWGLRKGLILMVLSVVGLIVGIILAGRYYVALSERLTLIPYESAAKIVAFLLILLGVGLAARLLAFLLGKLTSLALLGWINRIGGAILGLLLGALFCAVILAIWSKFFGVGETISGSGLANLLLNGLPFVLALLPSDFDQIRSFFQ